MWGWGSRRPTGSALLVKPLRFLVACPCGTCYSSPNICSEAPNICSLGYPIANFRWCAFHLRASFALGENAPNGCDQPIKFDRLAVELVAPRGERPFALAGERMCGESNNGDVAGLRIAP